MADRRYETLVLIHPDLGEPGSKELADPHPEADRGSGRDREPGPGMGAARARVPDREAAAGVLRALRVPEHAEGAPRDRAQPEAHGSRPALRLRAAGGERAAGAARGRRRRGARSGKRGTSRVRPSSRAASARRSPDAPRTATGASAAGARPRGAASVAAAWDGGRSAASAPTRRCSSTTRTRASLGNFLSERGKIIPSRITGNCARHQRQLTLAIKRARTVALLPYTTAYP